VRAMTDIGEKMRRDEICCRLITLVSPRPKFLSSSPIRNTRAQKRK
jgi:hypothetical protein